MVTVFCSECEHPLRTGHQLHQGQILICRQCATSFVVNETHPPKLEPLVDLPDNQPLDPNREGACPECDRPIRFRATLREGQRVTCGRCYAELEVVSLIPLELEPAIPKSRQQKRNQRRGSEARRRFEQQPFSRGRDQKGRQQKQQNRWHDDDRDDE